MFYQIMYALVLNLVWLWADTHTKYWEYSFTPFDPDLKFERERESERKRRTQLNHQTLITTLEEKLINGWVNKSQKSWNLALISQHPTLRVIIINLWAEILEVCKKIQHSFDLTFEQEPESKNKPK